MKSWTFLPPDRKWCFMDLVTDHVTGKLRESSVFSVFGKATILYEYVVHVTSMTFETMTLVVAAIVVGHEVGSRLMNMKQQQSPPSPESKP